MPWKFKIRLKTFKLNIKEKVDVWGYKLNKSLYKIK